MIRNIGTTDRVIRTLVAAALAVTVLLGQISVTFSVLFTVFTLILLVTAAIGFCPIYTVLRLSTRRAPTPSK